MADENWIDDSDPQKALAEVMGAYAAPTPQQPPAPAEQAPAEPLTLDRLLRTAVQVAVTTALPEAGATMGEMAEDLLAQHAAEGRALERVQALLTPAARLALIAELAQGLPGDLPPTLDLWRSDAAVALLRGLPGADVRRDAYVDSGKVRGVLSVRVTLGRLEVCARCDAELSDEEIARATAAKARGTLAIPLPVPLDARRLLEGQG